MNEVDWYELAGGPVLFQGDILFQCPVFLVTGPLQGPLRPAAEIAVDARTLDLVVMTHSCDLHNDKVEDVLLARVVSWSEAVKTEVEKGNDFVRGSKFRKLLIDGNVPGLSLIHKRDQEPRLAWSVVDFHYLYTLPKAFLSQFAAAGPPRLRLRLPYREHLAQAFARYFMRVGLPHDARAFEKEGDIKV
jgi:hypothetical protein